MAYKKPERIVFKREKGELGGIEAIHVPNEKKPYQVLCPACNFKYSTNDMKEVLNVVKRLSRLSTNEKLDEYKKELGLRVKLASKAEKKTKSTSKIKKVKKSKENKKEE